MFMFQIEKPEKVNRTIFIPKSLLERITKLSQEKDVSVNQIIIQCCEYALSHMEDCSAPALSVKPRLYSVRNGGGTHRSAPAVQALTCTSRV